MAKHRHRDRGRPAWPVSWLPVRWRGRRPAPDPFETLALQLRLARLSGEISGLRRDERQYAKALHLQAAMAAYDHALYDACRLAGIPLEQDRAEAAHVRRMLAEAALRDQGWTW